jgi:hypothetical protein
MSFQDISMKKLAIIIIAAGVIVVFVLSGFQARNVFAPSVTEEAVVSIKQGSTCVIEGSDRVPREILNCPYNQGDTVSITYKPQQPAIERHELVSSGSN